MSLRVGLLGLGTVGSAVGRRLVEERTLISAQSGVPVELAAVAVRDPTRSRDVELGGIPITGDAPALASDPEIDILVEVMGGMQPASQLIEAALTPGRAVVTANKTVIGRDGPRLIAIAERAGCPLRYEAAVGAGTPMVAMLSQSLLGDRLMRLCGVLNGTTNFILGKMSAGGMSFEAALSAAQALGYAEADPTADVDGEDAASKLAILARLGFGIHVDPAEVATEGIRRLQMIDVEYASQLGFSVKLIARAELGDIGLATSVRPTLVPVAHPLAALDGAGNGLVVESDLAGRIVITGAGAGAGPTASAVVGDVIAAARSLAGGPGGGAPGRPAPARPAPADQVEAELYIRVEVADEPDATDTVALMLEDRGVPVEGALDRAASERGRRDVIVLTRPAGRALIDHALETLETLPVVIRVAAALDRLSEPD